MASQIYCLQGIGVSAKAGTELFSSLYPIQPVIELVFSESFVKRMDGWVGG